MTIFNPHAAHERDTLRDSWTPLRSDTMSVCAPQVERDKDESCILESIWVG